MQFGVPQFIDIEDKVFGPLTFKQFVYVLGGAGAAVVFFYVLPNFIAVLFTIPVAGIAFLFAFKPVHGRPFSVVFESAFKYLFGGKLYLWKKEKKPIEKQEKTAFAESHAEESGVPRITGGKLENLSWNLDVQNKP